MKTTQWILIAAMLASASGASADERPTTEDLLAAFEKSVEKLTRVKIEWNQKGGEGAPYDQEMTVFRDGPRWKSERLLIRKTGNGPGQKVREQTLIGDEIITLSLRYTPLDDKPRFFGLTAARERVAIRTWTSGRLGCQVLFGRMMGDLGEPLWTVMRESGSVELLPKTEIIDGVETYILKSRGKYGEHKVWLDPASGGLPRRIEIHKLPGNLLDDEQLGATPAPKAEPSTDPDRRIPRRPARPHSEYWALFDKIQIENQKGVFVITGYESEVSITFADAKKPPDNPAQKPTGQKYEQKFRVEVDPKQFPADAFRFEIAIPNGTPVSVVDDYPLLYQGPLKTEHEWFDGKIRERVEK